jgi:ABC-2 type transport system permease protein
VFLEGADVSLLWPQYWPMALIGLVNLVLAARLFRHRLY